MPRTSDPSGEEGSAILEFILVAVAIVVPIFYLIVALARIQAGAYAVAQAARESARVYVTAPTAADGSTRARAAAALAFQDQGFHGGGGVAISCPEGCRAPGAPVVARTALSVPLPMIPGFLRGVLPASISVHATHTQQVPRYAERR